MADDAIYNQEVKGWGKNTLSKIKSSGKDQGIQHRTNSKSDGSSIEAIKLSTAAKDGKIFRIRFVIRRHLVYVAKGVGNGTPIEKVGTTSRKPKPFLGDPIENSLPELTQIAAEHYGQNLINRLAEKL
jgi:hypothetical protein